MKTIALIELFLTKTRYLLSKDPTAILCNLETPLQKNAPFYTEKPQAALTTVTVIIPFKDKWHLTENCLKGLISQEKSAITLHIILVDNNSEEKLTEKSIDRFIKENKNIEIKKIFCSKAFNFSYLNNLAVKSINYKTDYLWFLNNDISFLSKKTLKTYTEFAKSCSNLGALGSTLLYGDKKTVQHSFVAPGIKIAGSHPLKGTLFDKDFLWYQKPRAVPAVTGASFFVSYNNFCNVGMFDENLAFSCQDLDLCLRLNEINLVNWCLTQELLIHHESMSRSSNFCEQEIKYFYKKWGGELYKNSFYSKKFSTWNETPSFKIIPFNYPWKLALKVQNKLYDLK